MTRSPFSSFSNAVWEARVHEAMVKIGCRRVACESADRNGPHGLDQPHQLFTRKITLDDSVTQRSWEKPAKDAEGAVFPLIPPALVFPRMSPPGLWPEEARPAQQPLEVE
jgi:hypothetical protein